MAIVSDYTISGHVNSRTVAGRGRGRIDFDSGVSELEVTFSKIAPGWDPRTIVLMCCDRMNIMGSRPLEGAVSLYEASGGYASIGRHIVNDFRRAKATDDDDELVVDVLASSLTDLRGAGGDVRGRDDSRIEGGVSHLVPGRNGVAHIRRAVGLMQQASPKVVTVATSYEVELEDGSTMFGNTYYPHYLPEPKRVIPGPQLWRMDHVAQTFDGTTLHVESVTSLVPLVEVNSPAVLGRGALDVDLVQR